ncbi:MAG: glycosyltransferase family 4 protein [Calothrix sp. FI2-JRJ7]|jgi:spore coat protein SA|nr:glycosyltransferase family 4 protein [Calothrix sp. FI2-JRJ7]
MNKQNKVIHILTESEPFSQHQGGAISRWVGNIIYNSRSQVKSIVICPEADNSWQEIEYIKWKNLQKIKWLTKFTSQIFLPLRVIVCLRAFWRLKEIINSNDTVYVHNRPEYVIALAILKRLWKKNFDIYLHLHNPHLASNTLKKIVVKSVDKILFCSQFLLKSIAKDTNNISTTIIPNAADNYCFYPQEQSENSCDNQNYTILYVGRLIPEKGIHVLIEAVKALQTQNIRVNLKIVGAKNFGNWTDDPYINSLKTLSTEISESIQFAGYKTGLELAEEYRKATIFCCPSIWDEPFGMVNVEAMASGLPVIASNVGGIPEIFKDGGGILVPPNDPSALAEVIKELLNNTKYRQETAKRGYEIYQERFTCSKVAKLYVECVQ